MLRTSPVIKVKTRVERVSRSAAGSCLDGTQLDIQERIPSIQQFKENNIIAKGRTMTS